MAIPLPVIGGVSPLCAKGPTALRPRNVGTRGGFCTGCRPYFLHSRSEYNFDSSISAWRAVPRKKAQRVNTFATMTQNSTTSISSTEEWQRLSEQAASPIPHLRVLLADVDRCKSMIVEHKGMILDYSRQQVTQEIMANLFDLAKRANLQEKIDSMFAGEHINTTEDRAVLHVATRAERGDVMMEGGKNVVPDVYDVLDQIKDFSDRVRNGEWRGATGKKLTDVVCIGIGGSFLGPLFVHNSIRTDASCAKAAMGRNLRFLSNVDPVDVARSLNGLKQETTLVVVVSKTFTTAETMLNARTVRQWIISALGKEAVSKHMVAISTNLTKVEEFGIDPKNAFAFWDWVGGRYSVTSAVGILPLALQYGYPQAERFLAGAHDIDVHFKNAPFEQNLPVLLGLLGVWNATFKGYGAKAILPYCQALAKLAPHIQQVSMESNGKGVNINGERMNYDVGEVDFGEPGTNGQHSFYQLIHQGRTIPCHFIGLIKSQQSVYLKGEKVSNHDELMCNFFAQADALAVGKTPEELRAENVPESLISHKTFSGNRPSLSLMLKDLTPYTTGQILALYEHMVATQGFIWGVNSFDQWGVELGKVLATQVREEMTMARTVAKPVEGFNYSTTYMLHRYLDGKSELLYPEGRDCFPGDLIDECSIPTSYV